MKAKVTTMTQYHFGDRVRIITPDGLAADDRGEIVGININSFSQRYRVCLWHGGITMSYAEHELAPEEITPDHPDFQPSDYLTLEDFEAIMKGNEPAQPADQQRQPADADLTPDELATANGITLNRQQLLELKLRNEAPVDVVGESLWHDFYTEMGKLGLIYATPAGHSGIVTYAITPAGRVHLAALTSAPADVPTEAADEPTITVSLSDAHEIVVSLIKAIADYNNRASEPEHVDIKDFLRNSAKEMREVLNRVKAQINEVSTKS